MSETRTALKTYFETGDFPTQAQFESWLDSFFHLDDGVVISDITGNVVTLSDATQITVNGEINTVSNVGTFGEGVFIQKSGLNFELRKIKAGSNITIAIVDGSIEISAAAGAGEANTASNVGTGEGTIFVQKTGVNLELKKIQKGAGIEITNSATEIIIKEAPQDFTNLENYFNLVRQFKSSDYTTLLNTPEDIAIISDGIIAVSHRSNIINGGSPSTGDTNTGGLIFYDISDNTRPMVLSTWKDTNMVGNMNMVVVGKYLLTCSLRNPRVFILDVSDIYNVVKVGEVSVEPAPNTLTILYNLTITEDGKYVVVAYRHTSSTASKIVSIDITDKALPVIADSATHAGDWYYHLWTRKGKVFVSHYGGSTNPNDMSVWDIDTSGILTFDRIISQSLLNGTSHISVGTRDLMVSWNGDLSIFDIDEITGDIAYSNSFVTGVAGNNRIAILRENDVNIVAIAGYTNNQVALKIYNADFSTELGSGIITNLNFDVVQSISFVGRNLVVLNRNNSSVIMIYEFDFNLFSKTKKEYQ